MLYNELKLGYPSLWLKTTEPSRAIQDLVSYDFRDFYTINFELTDIKSEKLGEIEFIKQIDSSFASSIPSGSYKLFLRAEDKSGALSNILENSNCE